MPIDIDATADSHAGVFAPETLDEDDQFESDLGWQQAIAGLPVLLDEAYERLRANRPAPWRR